MKWLNLFTATTLLLASQSSFAGINDDVLTLQHHWADVNYQQHDDAQKKGFETLITEADSLVETYPQSAEAYIWRGIVKSSFAGAKGGLGAMSLAKAAKKDLEKALELNPNALSGSAYTSLGTLYFKVPGWPIGFGDDDKAEELLKKALLINPDGIDSNYFYAEYLIDQDHYKEAEKYLIKAQNAAPRPSRPLADKGRHHEISLSLDKVHKELMEESE